MKSSISRIKASEKLSMLAHIFNPSNAMQRQVNLCEMDVSLFDKASSRTAEAIGRPHLKKEWEKF